ncbi:MAG: biopolymer transporter ExbD [Gemmataceae bacterium]
MSTSEMKAEPNLTPMLDMVLQLVMFFMLCANFVADRANKSIKLPDSIEAKALDKDTESVIYLNVDTDGDVLLVPHQVTKEEKKQGGNVALTNEIAVQSYMKNRLHDFERSLKPDEQGKGKTPIVIIRADKNCTFRKVYNVMSACQKAGYKDVQLRVLKVGGKEG